MYYFYTSISKDMEFSSGDIVGGGKVRLEVDRGQGALSEDRRLCGWPSSDCNIFLSSPGAYSLTLAIVVVSRLYAQASKVLQMPEGEPTKTVDSISLDASVAGAANGRG